MSKKAVFTIILTFFFMTWGVLSGFCSEKASQRNIDIFVDGKRFDSFEDYKQYRIDALRSQIQEEAKEEAEESSLPQEGFTQEVVVSEETTADISSSATILPQYDNLSGFWTPCLLVDPLGNYLNRVLQNDKEP